MLPTAETALEVIARLYPPSSPTTGSLRTLSARDPDKALTDIDDATGINVKKIAAVIELAESTSAEAG